MHTKSNKILTILVTSISLFTFNTAIYAKTSNIKSVNLEALNLKTIKPKTENLKPSKKPLKVERKFSLGGQLTLNDSINGGKTYVSASATFKPNRKDYWFIKGTARHNFEENNDGFRYSWGLGYDDWHTGTWTAQLNNYDAIKPGEGLKIEKAIASVGYKVDSELLKKNKLRSSITLSKQIEGDPKLSVSLKWSPKSYWFVKGILIQPLDGGDPVYNYLFGYDDWHPKAFGFEYSNYDSNPLKETNFRKGRFSLTYKWKFK